MPSNATPVSALWLGILRIFSYKKWGTQDRAALGDPTPIPSVSAPGGSAAGKRAAAQLTGAADHLTA